MARAKVPSGAIQRVDPIHRPTSAAGSVNKLHERIWGISLASGPIERQSPEGTAGTAAQIATFFSFLAYYTLPAA